MALFNLEEKLREWLDKNNIRYEVNYEGEDVPFAAFLNQKTLDNIYYILPQKIIIMIEDSGAVMGEVMKLSGWKVIDIWSEEDIKNKLNEYRET